MPLSKLEIGGAVYLTGLTAKFIHRKKWKRRDPRKVLSVIPGTIQKVMVKKGDMVAQGDPLLILEAMKMRNEVRAHREGTIRSVHVQEGELVPREHLLIQFK